MRQVIEGKQMCNWTVDVELDANQYSTIRVANGTCYGDTDIQPIATVYDAEHARLIAAAPELLQSLRDANTLLLALRTKVSEADAPLINNWIKDTRIVISKAEGRGQ